ncbi:hypothetical protein EJ04DRAFT_564435 [Polyplosphaeria fusca]|uniref:Serine-rich protein n=1 Tax=Polyplosphaeria fusca TaxID=682080 RepID=A0A9P4V2D1_9PLEO|nr:hypothetical protein EJ04DRAFT_564435 [Polyplosphaeria fusca]
MSSEDIHTTHASQPSLSSPLSRAPKFSPPSSRNTSPRRRPLHDRSNSQTNQYSGPTIRIVEDPGTDVYSKTPFPSQPSQILPARIRPGYSFEDRGRRVSDGSYVANAVAKFETSHTLAPKPLQHKKAIRQSTSTRDSDADTVVASSFSPSASSRFSQGTTPPSSPSDVSHQEKGLEVLEELSSQPSRSTIRAVIPSSSSGGDPLEGHALTPRASAASLASTASTDTLTHRRSDHKRDSSSTSRPLPLEHKHTLSSGSDHQKQASSTNKAPRRPILKPSTESFAISDTSEVSDLPRSSTQSSPTLHDARQVSLASGVRVHFPVVRAPSANSLWAESQNIPSISTRMNTHPTQVHRWGSQLSTIQSESEHGSRSVERTSQSIDGLSHSISHDGHSGNGRAPASRRRQTISSMSSSDNISSDYAESSVVVPLPLFSPVTRPSNDDRDSTDERHDTVSPLQSPPLRTKRSFLRRRDSDSSLRPSSSQSDLSTFISTTIPAWARVYYRRGSLGAPDSASASTDSFRIPTAQSGRTSTPSEGNFPLSIYRPRNRPHQRSSYPESMSISEAPIEQAVYVIGPARRPLTHIISPRLRQDRRSQARLSAWKAPSFDDSLGTLIFSRQNRQILLFCFGFIFPLAWIIASFLPLPPDPDTINSTPSQMDLEQQFTEQLGPPDDRSYQKAVWWRNLNRIMSGIGTLLIGVIVNRTGNSRVEDVVMCLPHITLPGYTSFTYLIYRRSIWICPTSPRHFS